MKRIVLIVVLLLTNIVFSQKNRKENDVETFIIKDSLELSNSKKVTNHYNIRKERKLGVNAVLGGESIMASVSLDYFVTSTLNIGIGFGLIGGYVGAKYHFRGNIDDLKWTPYIGVSGIRVAGIMGGDSKSGVYFPAGIQYIGNKGFSFSIEAAALSIINRDDEPPIWGAIKTGYRFKP